MILSLWRRLFGRRLPPKLDYETAMAALDAKDVKTRCELACRADTRPEMLYYLANDSVPEVRRDVAGNPATPLQAVRLLSQDQDDAVRTELAGKIGRLLPGLESRDRDRLRDLTIEVLERLANDQLPRVRQLLAEEIKASKLVPKALVDKLARDVEFVVAAPILEYSPLLADNDLLEILAQGAIEGALPAIARRAALSANVADAVVATLDIPAVAALLTNKSAQIREETLDKIIDNAAEVKAWHGPLTLRADLSLRAVRRVAGFVASSLLRQLQERRELDEETALYLAKRVRERLAEERAEPLRDLAEIIRKAAARGELNDAYVLNAIEAHDRPLVAYALAALVHAPVGIVERVIDSTSAKAIVALCWRAGLSMRTALKLQGLSGRIAQKDLIPARRGIDYPMSEDEMIFQLDLFEIKAS